MSAVSKRTYRTKEFAVLTGVSVRALHHYDRLGLLKPRRTASGYRVYDENDLGVLEQIVSPGEPQPEPPFGKPVWEFMAKALAVRR